MESLYSTLMIQQLLSQSIRQLVLLALNQSRDLGLDLLVRQTYYRQHFTPASARGYQVNLPDSDCWTSFPNSVHLFISRQSLFLSD